MNSPINIGSRTTIFLFALALLALGIWAYLKDKRMEKKREAKEAKETEEQDEKRLRQIKLQKEIKKGESEKVIEVLHSQMTQLQQDNGHHDVMDKMIPLANAFSIPESWRTHPSAPVSYTHLTLPTTPYV